MATECDLKQPTPFEPYYASGNGKSDKSGESWLMEGVKSSPNNSANRGSRSFSPSPILSPSPTLPSLFHFVSSCTYSFSSSSLFYTPFHVRRFVSYESPYTSLPLAPRFWKIEDRRENHSGLTFIVSDNLWTVKRTVPFVEYVDS